MDHPRVGGEKPNRILWDNFKRGSPPRGRGKVVRHRCILFDVGITPAWAGKSRPAVRWSAQSGDHPRVGGEKHNHSYQQGLERGSPPRGRGKVDVGIPMLAPVRITPAWAGKRKALFALVHSTEDHPRVGGEKHSWLNVGTSL